MENAKICSEVVNGKSVHVIRKKEKINWDISEYCLRLAVVELCGWVTKKGHATATGKRIARTAWDDQTSAAKRILTKHGIEK